MVLGSCGKITQPKRSLQRTVVASLSSSNHVSSKASSEAFTFLSAPERGRSEDHFVEDEQNSTSPDLFKCGYQGCKLSTIPPRQCVERKT